MIIEKVDDGKKFPRCPDCDVVLIDEGTEYSHTQVKQMKVWDECDYEYAPSETYRLYPVEVCTKCGYRIGVEFFPAARLMRCPKCAALYHVE